MTVRGVEEEETTRIVGGAVAEPNRLVEAVQYDPNDIEQVIALLVKKHPELGTALTDWEIIYLKPAQSIGDFSHFILLVKIGGQETFVRGYARLKNGRTPAATVNHPTHLWDVLYICSGPLIEETPNYYNHFVNIFQGREKKTQKDIDYLATYLQTSFPNSWGRIELNRLKTLLNNMPYINLVASFSVGE